MRRFFCSNDSGERRIVAEQVDGPIVRCGRRSVQLHDVVRRIAPALGGQSGARPCGGIVSAMRRMTLLRLIRALPEPEIMKLQVIEVDE